MVRLRDLLKNKLVMQMKYHFQEYSINQWPFWELEEQISIMAELAAEEKKQRDEQEAQQKQQMPKMPSIPKIPTKFK